MAPTEPINPAPTPGAPPAKPTLLIVDDEAGPRESLRIVFKDRYQCAVATCGREGIEYARHHSVDAAILDIKMPDLSGVDVLRELKQIDPHTECIMLTGFETIETARAAVRCGAADYLNKPFDVFALRDILEKCIARRRQRLATEQALVSLKTTNEELARELAQSNRAVTAGLLSAGVIHELNNPLSIISGYTQLLGRDLASLAGGNAAVAQDVQERLRNIQHEIERCRDIARRFLGFARARQVAPEFVAAQTLLEDTAALLRVHPATREVKITVAAGASDLRIEAYPAEILQVLLNFAINALQAMSGSGQLTLAAAAVAQAPAQPAFRPPSFQPGRPLARLSVTDTGAGIPQEVLPKLFQPYFTTKPQGTGMGLALAAEIIGSHGGLIDVGSVIGQGSTFSLYLPRAAQE